MLTLLATSLMISQTVFSILPLTSTVTMRQIHTLVAYAALLIAGLHLGLHWAMLMGIARSRFGISTVSKSRTYLHRASATVIAAGGAYALSDQKVGSKLLMQQSFEFGDLEASVPMFIMQHVAIVGLFASLAHYGQSILRRAMPRQRSRH